MLTKKKTILLTQYLQEYTGRNKEDLLRMSEICDKYENEKTIFEELKNCADKKEFEDKLNAFIFFQSKLRSCTHIDEALQKILKILNATEVDLYKML